MTHTTQQLQAMSDFERNKAIALRLYPDAAVFRSFSDDETDAITIVSGEFTKIMVDYCNNPNDIMPLAFERGISLISLSDGYMATKIKDIYMAEQYRSLRFCDPSCEEYADTNPLRAIACLLLMMDE